MPHPAWQLAPVPTFPGSALSTESELKKREIQTKLDLLNKKQAARESASGRLGIGNRAVLIQRLRELQRNKELKEEAEQLRAQNGDLSGVPVGLQPSKFISPTRLAQGHSTSSPAGQVGTFNYAATSAAVGEAEWGERLRQAKAKYWSTLDQLAPDWKANTQQRRLDQLAKYEKAIDALLARRQQASLAYAKERELQKLLTAKQMELHNLAAHEREEVRARQLARGQPAPPPMTWGAPGPAMPTYQMNSPGSRPMSAPYAAAAAAPTSPYHQPPPPAQHFSPQHQPYQPRPLSPHYPAAGPAVSSSQSHYARRPQPHGLPLSSEDDDYLHHQSRLATTQREVADLDAWRGELAAEERLRATRREERELEAVREKKLALERRKALEMEQEAMIRSQMLQSKFTGVAVAAAVTGTSTTTTIAPSQPQPISMPQFQSSYQPQQQPQQQILTRADSVPSTTSSSQPQAQTITSQAAFISASTITYQPPTSQFPKPVQQPIKQDLELSVSKSRLSSHNSNPLDTHDHLNDPEQDPRHESTSQQRADTAEALRRQQAAEEEQRRATAAAQERERATFEQQQQQQQQREWEREQQRQRDEQERQRQQQQQQQEALERQRRQQQQQQESEAAAAVKAKADAEEAAREAAAAAAEAQSRAVAAAASASSSEDEPGPSLSSGFGGLFGGGSLGFLGNKKKPPQKSPPNSSRPSTAPANNVTKTTTTAAASSATSAATSKKPPPKKKVDSDDDTSEEDETELKVVQPTLSSAMLKKKPLSARGIRKPIWQTDADLDEPDLPTTKPTTSAKSRAALPEEDEFAF